MVKLVKLTSNKSEEAVWVNPEHIVKMRPNYSGGSTLWLVDKESFIRVTENPEEVLARIQAAPDLSELPCEEGDQA